jgi:hypothetical protein
MAKRKLLTVLYFLNGSAPTTEDEAAMAEFGQGHVVRQRNALLIHDGDAIEDFDIVAGAVPETYAIAAAEKGEPPEPPVPPSIDAETVPAGSPVAPVKGDGKPADPPKPAADAKPVPPKPKPGAGWKPNA